MLWHGRRAKNFNSPQFTSFEGGVYSVIQIETECAYEPNGSLLALAIGNAVRGKDAISGAEAKGSKARSFRRCRLA